MLKTATKKTVASVCAIFFVTSAQAFDLSETLFEVFGKEVGLDPKLIYSVALAESARANNSKLLSPHPWTLRADTAFYGQSKEEAKEQLNKLLQKTKSVDVGLMQVNVRWHGDKVSKPEDLLDPVINMRVGTNYLAEMIRSTPHDLELAIGKYHVGPTITNDNKDRAKNYGQRVLAIYKNILDLASNSYRSHQ